ncbi:ATP-binding protein [Streptomyces decoyicus]|uniref:ATP-binding protein n=1 Tax=Streptomyces decoyicus TaxID=249567 RepID=UPI003869E281
MLIERDEQVSLLARQFEGLTAGKGGTVVVSGPAGSGKTALLRAFLGEVADKCPSGGGTAVTLLTATGLPVTRSVPLGLISQLLMSVELPADLRREIDGDIPEPLVDHVLTPAAAQLAQRIVEAVLALAAERPVVIAVDDVQDGDALSLECLTNLARRPVANHVLVVATVRSGVGDAPCRFHGALMHEGIGSGIRLGRLSKRGVVALAADRLGRAVADRIGSACYEATGGSCLLAHAVLEDHAAEYGGLAEQRGNELFAGEAFGRAVLGCLDRGGSAARRVAETVAVLGDGVAPELLADVAGVPEHTLADAVETLDVMGVLRHGGFRHPVARDAVLTRLTAADREAMHARGAGYLQRTGGPVDKIVEHLLAARTVPDQNAVLLLQCVAEQALLADDLDRATQCLRLAVQHCADERRRAAIVSRLATVVWRNSPLAVAERHLRTLIKASHEGTLPADQVPKVLCYMLWHGRVEEAGDLISKLYRGDDGAVAPTAEDTHSLEWWLRHSYPPLAARIPPRERVTGSFQRITPNVVNSGRTVAAGLISSVLEGAPADNVVIGAQQILQSCPLGDESLETLATALISLLYVDRLDLARPWCDELIERSRKRGAPTWTAVLCSVRADIARREGYMAATVRYANEALDVMPAYCWGTNIGVVRASLIVGHTRMDEYEEAAEQLHQPVPEGIFESRFGLHYLFARGQYHLAIGRHYAALNDFNATGDLLAKWGMDLPGIVAWRSAAAECHLALGQKGWARELAEEQLRLSPSPTSRPAGLATRVLAATKGPKERVPLLDAAVEVFTRCGARFHLARTLLDLANIHHELGEDGKARLVIGHARRMAKECRARRLQRDVPAPRTPERDETADRPRWSPMRDDLSDAERRVASLAGLGHTNRQIAEKLYVTVSTVEQHLTRAYRKLGISRRSDLNTALRLQVVEAI